jgi:hypothetical protein
MTRAAGWALGVFAALTLLFLALAPGSGALPDGSYASRSQSDLRFNHLYLEYLRSGPPSWSGHVPALSVVGLAASQAGAAYRYGGVTPSGFDCSGFTGWVYANRGVSLPRTSGEQSRAGLAVARGALAPGDLVFFGRDGRVGHVGIYVSGGSFIHSSGAAGKVGVDSLASPYWNEAYAGARRVLPQNGGAR